MTHLPERTTMPIRTQEPLTMTDLTTETTIAAYVAIIAAEVEELADLFPEALERQWTKSSAPRNRDEDERRAMGERPSDPTADAALDPRRDAVRDTVLRGRLALRDAAITLRGVRRAMERSIDWYDGE